MIAAGLLFGLLIAGLWPAAGSPPSPFFEQVHRWQTLVGALVAGGAALLAARIAWRAVRDQIQSNKLLADEQLGEMRRQFRHQMDVVTVRDRVAIDRETKGIASLLERNVERIDRIEKDIRDGKHTAAASRWRWVVENVRALEEWITTDKSIETRKILSLRETGRIHMLALKIKMHVDDGLATPGVDDLSHIREDAVAARDAVVDVRERVAGWVPKEG
ncbi:hypothetical protein [Bauldia litoralis]|nr:hypothetical protein [Bauldia litoralis]